MNRAEGPNRDLPTAAVPKGPSRLTALVSTALMGALLALVPIHIDPDSFLPEAQGAWADKGHGGGQGAGAGNGNGGSRAGGADRGESDAGDSASGDGHTGDSQSGDAGDESADTASNTTNGTVSKSTATAKSVSVADIDEDTTVKSAAKAKSKSKITYSHHGTVATITTMSRTKALTIVRTEDEPPTIARSGATSKTKTVVDISGETDTVATTTATADVSTTADESGGSSLAEAAASGSIMGTETQAIGQSGTQSSTSVANGDEGLMAGAGPLATTGIRFSGEDPISPQAAADADSEVDVAIAEAGLSDVLLTAP